MIEFREATEQDAYDLAPRLREGDLQELKASCGSSGEEALLASLEVSELAWAALEDGEVFAMFGVAPLNDLVGIVWLLGSPKIATRPVTVMRTTRKYINIMQDRFEILTNYIDTRNVKSLSWLESVGFRPAELCQEYGLERRPFIRYERIRYV